MRLKAKGTNDRGHVVGQDHHRAWLTNHEVDLIHTLRDEGMALKTIASKFECSLATVKSISSGRRRGHTVTGQKWPRCT